jgi:hypothetical protein
MDINLLPDLERRQQIASENGEEPTYTVIEYKGYYARISYFAGVGELFKVLPSKYQDEDPVSGVVVRSSKSEGVSLLLLDKPLNINSQPFIATKLYTEFFKANHIYDDSKSTS